MPAWLARPIPPDALALPNRPPFIDVDDGHALAQAIVDTTREPLLVLDKNLRVITASRSFYSTFNMKFEDVHGRPVYALGDGQWNIPELRLLLENITAQHGAMEAYEVEQDFSGIGRRTMLLNARKVFYRDGLHTTILLAIEDITERRAKERALEECLKEKDVLLQEIQHRVANTLQIVASILLLKAKTVRSEETRLHLHDAHQRVMSVAAVQRQLNASDPAAMIELGPYLTRLCETLAASIIGGRPIALKVHAAGGAATSSEAVSLGLIVTELVINALKHAFPADRSDAAVTVTYDRADPAWTLTVSDNGVGKPADHVKKTTPALGTTIIQALAKQLHARVDVAMNSQGTTVAVTRAAAVAQVA